MLVTIQSMRIQDLIVSGDSQEYKVTLLPDHILACPNAFLQAIAGSNERWPASVENQTD